MEYYVMSPSGEVLAGPFPREDEARRWIGSYHGQVAFYRWGRLYIAERSAEGAPAAICVARWPGRTHVPAAAWALQREGDLVLVEGQNGWVEAWMFA